MDNPEKQNYDDLIKVTKVKEVLNDQGLRMSGDLQESLNDSVLYLITKAAKRATANGRTTVSAKDL